MLKDEYFDIKDNPRDFLTHPLFNDQDFIIKKILKINKIDIRNEINRNVVFRNLEAQNILNNDIFNTIRDEHFRNEKILTNKEIDWLLTNFCGEFFLTKQFLLDLTEKLTHYEDKDNFNCPSCPKHFKKEHEYHIKDKLCNSKERKRFVYIFELKKIRIINLLSKSLAEKNSIKINTLVDWSNLNLNMYLNAHLKEEIKEERSNFYFEEKEFGNKRWKHPEKTEAKTELVNFLINNFNKVLIEINNIDNKIINNQTIELLEGSSYKEHINNKSFESELMDNISIFSHYSSKRKQDFYNTPYVASHLYYKAIIEIEKVLRRKNSSLQNDNIDDIKTNEINSKQEILNKISEAKEFVTWLLFALNYKTKFFFVKWKPDLESNYYSYNRNYNFLNSIKDVGVYNSWWSVYRMNHDFFGDVFFEQEGVKKEEIINLNVNNWDFSETIIEKESIRFGKKKNKDINLNFLKINFHDERRCNTLKIESSFSELKVEKHKQLKRKLEAKNLYTIVFILFITTTTCLSILKILSLLYYKKNKNNINKYANKQ